MYVTVTLNAALDKTHVVRGFQVGRVNPMPPALTMAGGKGVNVARVLHMWGEPVIATGLVAGATGTQIEACLAAEGIAHGFQRLQTGESRTCLAIVHPDLGGQTELNEQGPVVDAAAFAGFLQRFEGLARDATWIALSGSLPPGLDARAYLELMAIAGSAGVPVALDTSGVAAAAALAGCPDLYKPNQAEAEALLGLAIHPENLPGVLGALLERGPKCVMLSLGAAGAAIATRQEACFITAPHVEVISPIGSGDALLATLMVGLAAGLGLAPAAVRAVAAGTANAAVTGAAACSRVQIEALAPHVRVTSLADASWSTATRVTLR